MSTLDTMSGALQYTTSEATGQHIVTNVPGKARTLVSVGGLEHPASTSAEWRSGSTELNARGSGRGIRTPIVPGNSRTLYLLSYPTTRRIGWDLNPLA
jgi:hypothetical protein